MLVSCWGFEGRFCIKEDSASVGETKAGAYHMKIDWWKVKLIMAYVIMFISLIGILVLD